MQESCTFILYIHLDNVKKKKEKENPLFVVPNHPQCKRIDRFEQRLTRAVARRWLVNNEVSFTVNFSWSNPKGGLARHSCYILCHWALRDFHGGRGGGPSRPVTTVYRLLPLVWRRRLCHLPSLLPPLPFLPAQTLFNLPSVRCPPSVRTSSSIPSPTEFPLMSMIDSWNALPAISLWFWRKISSSRQQGLL